MSVDTPVRNRRDAEARRESLHRDTALRGPRASRLPRARCHLRADRPPGDPAGGRRRRRRGRISRARCSRSRSSVTGICCSLLTAIGLGGYALWRLAQALIGHTPEYGQHSALDRIGAARELPRVRHVLRARHHRPARDGRNSSGPASEDHGRCPAVAGRARARRSRRPPVRRASPLPGLPRSEQEVPQLLEDRPDVGVGAAQRSRSSESSAWSRAPSRSR